MHYHVRIHDQYALDPLHAVIYARYADAAAEVARVNRQAGDLWAELDPQPCDGACEPVRWAVRPG